MKALTDLLTDPYERKARITPGLLVALPLLVPLVCVYGSKHPILTAVVALLGGCGAIYALASIARGRGKQLETRLIKEWGGMPTTIALRHRDNFFDPVSKAGYHESIRQKLKIQLPTPEDEENDPGAADGVYAGATRRLRELTRGDKGLLLKENIAYGFHRNMLAMRPVGIISCLIGLTYGSIIGKFLLLTPPHVDAKALADPGLASGLTMLISISLLVAWLFYFNKTAVRHIGFAYAERLFERLTTLKTTATTRKAKAP